LPKSVVVYFWEQKPPIDFVPIGNILKHAIQALEGYGIQIGKQLQCGFSKYGYESPQLVDIVLALEEHSFSEHFSEYAADGPDVDGLGVGIGDDEDLRRPVRPGGDVVGNFLISDFLPG
jgi:hypothetical protein